MLAQSLGSDGFEPARDGFFRDVQLVRSGMSSSVLGQDREGHGTSML